MKLQRWQSCCGRRKPIDRSSGGRRRRVVQIWTSPLARTLFAAALRILSRAFSVRKFPALKFVTRFSVYARRH
jgi:hypothetical protein